MKQKRRDECQFCTSRKCYHRIKRAEDPIYDEVYCDKHIEEAETRADEYLGARGSKIFRDHISSTGPLSRDKFIGHCPVCRKTTTYLNNLGYYCGCQGLGGFDD